MQIYNTATRSLETFIPAIAGKVGLYTCGPTVYSYAHIGNLRTYVFEDVLRRMLAREGYAVRHVMNVTDVGHLQSDADSGDDKMMVAALREQRSPWEIAQFYEAAFFRHAEMLGIMRPHVVARATEHIPEMIAFVEKLMALGFAYESGGNVYFDVSKFPRYADFARLDMKGARATDRAAFDDLKRSQVDFALWFSQSKFPNQIMQWDSPWGRGFPGWHIECSAMSISNLGETLDFHTGGEDNIFPHHENEIAQSEGATGKKFVNYWVHARFLLVDGEKMSKSKGNFYTLKDIESKGFDPLAYRYLCLTAHFQTQMNFTWQSLEDGQKALEKLRKFVSSVKADKEGKVLDMHMEKFKAALEDNLNTPLAIAAIWEMFKDKSESEEDKKATLLKFDEVLGFGLAGVLATETKTFEISITPEENDKINVQNSTGEKIDENVINLIKEREMARRNKDFTASDHFRDELKEKGYGIGDTPKGLEITKLK